MSGSLVKTLEIALKGVCIHKIASSISKSSRYKGDFIFDRWTASQKTSEGLTAGARPVVRRLTDGLLTTLFLLPSP